MLTQQDLKAIRRIVKEEVKAEVRPVVKDEIATAISASERRLTQKIEDAKNEIIADFGNFMHDNIIPQLDEKADKADIERLEQKLDLHISQHPNQIRIIS